MEKLEECTQCSHSIAELYEAYPGVWVVSCANCYDGAPDSCPQIVVTAGSKDEAVRDWNEQQREGAA